MLGIITGIVLAIYLLILIFVYFGQKSILFYPTREIDTTPLQSGLAYEDIYFETKDGVKLNGWYIPVDSAVATLIFCHGNAGNISHRMASIEQFHQLNLNVFIFDYRGYGKSAGSVSEAGTYADADAAWTYLTKARGISPDRIVVFGRSLGGGIASWLAQNRLAKALILESTFTSIPDVAAKYYPFLPVRLITRYKYNSLERVKDLAIPKLFIHSRTDDIIPFELGQRLYQKACEPKQFMEISGGHNDGFTVSHDIYTDKIKDFLADVFPDYYQGK